ncbi:DUF6379 domain-containing protein [Klebsiella oxytoca]|uniref:C-glycoside deglycosidase beta subunit domain-containing protein n=1 Tax=Klebsiella oxytoca TaxID=571 RepID=UPI003570BDEB
MFDELMLPDTAVLSRRKKDGLTEASLRLRLPWYRSLPISCITGIDLSIDGHAIQSDSLTISFGDIYHSLSETSLLTDVSWFVLDQATVKFPVTSDLSPGAHNVSLSLALRIPYQEPEYCAVSFSQTAEHSRSVEFQGEER